MSRHSLIIFAKLPVAGKVKTRLGVQIGADRAAKIYDGFARHAFTLGAAMMKGGTSVYLFYDPTADEESMRTWAGESFVYTPQKGNTLGDRMEAAFAKTFADGSDASVIIGTDVPELSMEVLQVAFEQLRSQDAVIGPSTDGGYYLLGMRGLVKTVFTDIAWSTEEVFRETVRRLKSLSVGYHTLPVFSDIDTEEDYLAYLDRIESKIIHPEGKR